MQPRIIIIIIILRVPILSTVIYYAPQLPSCSPISPVFYYCRETPIKYKVQVIKVSESK